MARSNQSNRLALGILVLLIAIAVAVFLFYPAPRHTPQPGPQPGNPNLLLGNPSNATSDSYNKDNYLLDKKYFVLSYNSSKGIPNWVSWRVTRNDMGKAPRKQTFDPDNQLPAGFTKILSRDYSESGFDRGHMCPHADRQANQEMSYATFVMTNIIPQAPHVNRDTWEHMESYCRSLVSRKHQRLYIVAGPAGVGGTGENGPKQSIGRGRVNVPAECWKIIVAVPDTGTDDVSTISADTRVISVLMPNDQSIDTNWANYRTTPVTIEGKTGLHFFTSLPQDVADALRHKMDTVMISSPR